MFQLCKLRTIQRQRQLFKHLKCFKSDVLLKANVSNFDKDFVDRLDASRLNSNYRTPEETLVPILLDQLQLSKNDYEEIRKRSRNLIENLRNESQMDIVDQVIQGFPLTKKEGVLLMCLAEAMLRTPDQMTRESLLRDKLSQAHFDQYLKDPSSLLMNMAIRSFAVGSEVVKGQFKPPFMTRMADSTVPVMEKVADRAMRFMAKKFVVGTSIDDAVSHSLKTSKMGYTHSFDMLGEAAVTNDDAEMYFEEYLKAIHAIAMNDGGHGHLHGDSLSVKLSALHPRYSFAQEDRVLVELGDRLFKLCMAAADANIPLTLDAEETERLELSLKLLTMMAHHPELQHWDGLGLAVQAYQKRSLDVIDFLVDLASSSNKQLKVRLVKGAYWDSEIKRCQELGFQDYPVFTRKETTDVSYMACAQKMLAHPDKIFPQFATHNALTIMTIMQMAKDNHSSYEFQKLHGMGDELYNLIISADEHTPNCRIYAPVGKEKELLPYLVRRLLENGANNSFVNNLMDKEFSLDELVQFPHEKLMKFNSLRHTKIPLPRDLFGRRENSPGIDLDHPADVKSLLDKVQQYQTWRALPLIDGIQVSGIPHQICNPSSKEEIVGVVEEASPQMIDHAMACADEAFGTWNQTNARTRSECLERTADLILQHQHELIALCVREAGKSLKDAVAEIREAVDFCRYYAEQGEAVFGSPVPLPGPTGEQNQLIMEGRGVFVCISPWNFPLAIYVGQIAAALMAGNSVIAKPARQTPLIAFRMCQLFYEGGIPKNALQFLPGDGISVGQSLLKDDRVTGVAFTGSTETARIINRTLASRDCAIATLIAETGGQNAMIVDSSALAEQVVADVISSAFQSAGQRCSALRLLLLQEEIAPRVLHLLKGAMAELKVGNPAQISTDVGPVIDEDARAKLADYQTKMKNHHKLIHECQLEDIHENGFFVPPMAFEISTVESLKNEVFGPILHVMRFSVNDLDDVLNQIKSLKFGLCFGLHSRLDNRMSDIAKKIPAGNVYINRNTIGAVVGAQPFGGQGLSGTGPKAGGPHYLHRFATEKCISRNITAQGGNASLMTLHEDV